MSKIELNRGLTKQDIIDKNLLSKKFSEMEIPEIKVCLSEIINIKGELLELTVYELYESRNHPLVKDTTIEKAFKIIAKENID